MNGRIGSEVNNYIVNISNPTESETTARFLLYLNL